MNIMHRDIKSENILLEKTLYQINEEDVVAKIADFGLATYVDPQIGGE
jgi:serine/threonine protein kinase